jgi:hypothetical protein
MDWQSYGSFLVFAVVLILVPGPDFAVVTKNALAGGRRSGIWASVGVASSNAVQGIAAAIGLGAVVMASQPLFEAIKWAGVGYLAYLGVQALRSALRGHYPDRDGHPPAGRGSAMSGWRQGFLSNITNPKVLVFLPRRPAAVPDPRNDGLAGPRAGAQPRGAGVGVSDAAGHRPAPGTAGVRPAIGPSSARRRHRGRPARIRRPARLSTPVTG